MKGRAFLARATLGVVAFGACNVYDSSLLTGDGGAAPGTGGSAPSGGASGSAGTTTGGSSGTTASGGTSGTGGSASPEGGEAGGDMPTGGTSSGGSAGSNSGGAAAIGGMSGTTSGGTAGTTGAGAGGTAGSAAGAGAGGAGNGGKAGGGSGGMAGAAGGGPGGAGAGGGGAIVQLSGTASADSVQTNPAHPAAHGNDGMTATRWCAANGATGHYWTLDLGAVHALSRFEVVWEYPTSAVGLPYGYVVSVSNDGTMFTTAIDRTTTTDTMQLQTSNFPPATSGRHVRVTTVTLPTGAWASFFEARVFGQ